MKNLLVGGVCLVSAFSAQANLNVYANAHGDDAALFMGQSLSHDVKSVIEAGDRIVLITTTAGDAGAGTGNGQGVAANYLARELGHSNVLQFLWGKVGANHAKISSETVNLAGKSVHRTQIAAAERGGYVAWYNIRLPDGNMQGQGYPSTGSQSLLRLDNASIAKISAVDQSAVYSKAELIHLFQNIIKKEGRGIKTISVNLPDQNNQGLNAEDHADHQTTSRLFSLALNQHHFKCVGQNFYATYVNADKPINMNTENLWTHIAMWGSLNQGLTAGGQSSTWDSTHNAWLGREYKTQSIAASNNCKF
ncbi:GlcNAc-PI de-N-acetylase [Acinetobacter calcoaceticus]|uniref:GlcNAc-PI de-N-acetylase n=1 Tax=Acinetobacter calcoaceticus TaxID=471 RepID=A0A4R1Y987_ACICA|nr:GlcNAc-PI de-N-acetylase [Acinetobacter calcoaceticus]